MFLNIQSIKNSLLHSLNSDSFHPPLLFLLIKLRVSGRTSAFEVLGSAIRNWASASRQSLIIIIHKTLGPGSGQAWYRTQERCDAKQEGLQLPPCSPLSLSPSLHPSEPWFSTMRRGCVHESVEQKPNHFRRLRPLGRRDADVGWRTPFRLSSFLTHPLLLRFSSFSRPRTASP